eukprot:TRINITY_DN15559_c0_g1_i1.p1 TRINITY_DN15559_c0_g1~~TRINITY_DN15559_c0_g1_i1.p1  ORF type:complete len:465 (+),score=99.19 TRINITY_DN15559_c0_g1_i1:86-1396(+)
MSKQNIYVIGALHSGRTQLIHALVYGTFGNTETETNRHVSRNVARFGPIHFDFSEFDSSNEAMTVRSDVPRVLVYDVHDAASVKALTKFAVKGKTVVVATKSDDPALAQSSPAHQAAAQELVVPTGCPHLTVSAKTNAHLGDLWEAIIAICFPETASHTNSNVKVKTIDELKSYWTAFARSFSDNLAWSTTANGVNMLTYMKMAEATDVLEMACGSGLLARFALQNFLSPTAKYTATDLSPAMLEIAKQTLSSVDGNRIKYLEANGEQLPFENDSFDRVIANYVLHLTTDPVKMLQEVYRVLRPGAVAGFSMWGRPENSPQFTINNVALKKLGVEMSSSSRSSFHLHDLQKTSDMVRQAAGFSRVVAYYTTAPFDIWTSSEFRKRTEGTETIKAMLKDLSAEQVELFWKYCEEEFERIQREGSILRHEGLIVIAFK